MSFPDAFSHVPLDEPSVPQNPPNEQLHGKENPSALSVGQAPEIEDLIREIRG